MTYNEIQFLLFGFSGGIFFICLYLLYLKYQMRDFPTFKELISEQRKNAEKMTELLREQRKDLDKRMEELVEQGERLLEDYDEPDKSLH